MRTALEVVLVGHQDDFPVRGDRLDDERPGADRLPHERILAREIDGVGRTVLRDHLEAELGQRVQDGSLERELHGVIGELLDALDELVAHLERRGRLGMHHDLVGEHDVVGRERPRLLAVPGVPHHVLAQVEGVAATVLARLPALRQLGDDFLLRVDADQAVEDQLGDAQRDHLVAGDRIERRGAAVLAVPQGASVRPPVVLGPGRGHRRRPDDD